MADHPRTGYTDALFCSCKLDPMTLMNELDLDLVKMRLHIRNEVVRSRLLNKSDRHTHRHIDRQTRPNVLPCRVVKSSSCDKVSTEFAFVLISLSVYRVSAEL